MRYYSGADTTCVWWQAGMSGKADERFTGGGVDSLEQKLLSKKLKSQEQLEEVGCLS